MQISKNCIVIVGPTAVGKTAFAVEAAQYFNTEIISADSRQCYKELNIGVAKPSAEELALVPHHFISSHSIHDMVNTAVFEQYALSHINKIFETHDTAVVVGGTGLYVKTFCYGIDDVPEVDAAVRQKIVEAYDWEGIPWLQQQLEKEDALYFSKGDMQNPQRMMRALEVKRSTKKSIIEFHTQPKKQRDFNIKLIGLELPKEELHSRINKRVDQMMANGLLNEVKQLRPYEKLNALQTVGYRELFGHLKGDLELEDAIEIIKINTRQYAKRQMTWFKKDEAVQWIPSASDAAKVMEDAGFKM